MCKVQKGLDENETIGKIAGQGAPLGMGHELKFLVEVEDENPGDHG